MATLKDVAERAGVSAKTVSRVVNGDGGVSAQTRETILGLVRELGYAPNLVARAMRLSSTGVIGFLTDVVATTPLSVEIVRGANARMRERRLRLLIANTDRDPALAEEYWTVFREQRVDGAIYATMFHRDLDIAVPAMEAPVVLVNCFDLEGRFPAILPDDEAGGRLQAEHLLALGHTAPVVITLHPDIPATHLRNAGIRSVYAAAGHALPEAAFVAGERGAIGLGESIAFEAAMSVLGRADRPSAVICGNDQVALSVYSAAAALGLHIPDDLSVVGFDDFGVIARGVTPKLTTVYLPYFEMGALAVDLIAEEEARAAHARTPTLVPCRLVERGSTAPARPT
jgi:LacI family transcriptional regulator